MKSLNIKAQFKGANKLVIIAASIMLLYLLCSLYFTNHYFFNTMINGVNVSLKTPKNAEYIIKSFINDYEIILIEKSGEKDVISGQEIRLVYNDNEGIANIKKKQKSFRWICSLFKKHNYYVGEMYSFHKGKLIDAINSLNCLNKDIIEPRNVSFQYLDGTYEAAEAIYGNKINKDKLYDAIKISVLNGNTELNIIEKQCYEEPKYTIRSDKTLMTWNLLKKYVSTKVTYNFGNKQELIDGNIINEWLSVDENLDVVFDKKAVMKFVYRLATEYNTVGVTRYFKTSLGKVEEIKGGLYGWKIDQVAEIKALFENINRGEVIIKEPIYTQKALFHGDNDIGNTYIEINITKQHLWFYKEGTLVAHGSVVTGNPNNGNATVVGTYMINYKENGSTLSGRNYNVKVSYWMPFYGNIGLHDARWRNAFGGVIYKTNGTHGCVNAPLYLAKTIFENVKEGTPVICYEEQ